MTILNLLGADEHDFSLYGDLDEDGATTVTQMRYYLSDDNGFVVAVGELNAPNNWDDEAFEEFCEDIVNPPLDREARELLRQTAGLLRFYEQNHRDKVKRLTDDDAIKDTIAKAERNAEQALKIEQYLERTK